MKLIKKLQRKMHLNLNLDNLLKRGSPEQVRGFLNDLYTDPEMPKEVADVLKKMLDALDKKESVDAIIPDEIRKLKEGAKDGEVH
jgi:hypothetical protein